MPGACGELGQPRPVGTAQRLSPANGGTKMVRASHSTDPEPVSETILRLWPSFMNPGQRTMEWDQDSADIEAFGGGPGLQEAPEYIPQTQQHPDGGASDLPQSGGEGSR